MGSDHLSDLTDSESVSGFRRDRIGTSPRYGHQRGNVKVVTGRELHRWCRVRLEVLRRYRCTSPAGGVGERRQEIVRPMKVEEVAERITIGEGRPDVFERLYTDHASHRVGVRDVREDRFDVDDIEAGRPTIPG